MTTSSDSSETAKPAERLAPGTLPRAGLIAAVVSVVVNLAVFYAAEFASGTSIMIARAGSTELEPLPTTVVLFVSVMAVVVAMVLLYFLNRFTSRPYTFFLGLAAVVLVLSFGPILSQPSDASIKVPLGVMHVVSAAVIVWTFLTRTKEA